jgi:hypothetical protein
MQIRNFQTARKHVHYNITSYINYQDKTQNIIKCPSISIISTKHNTLSYAINTKRITWKSGGTYYHMHPFYISISLIR